MHMPLHTGMGHWQRLEQARRLLAGSSESGALQAPLPNPSLRKYLTALPYAVCHFSVLCVRRLGLGLNQTNAQTEV